jgi:hypothetical protein
MAVVPATGLGPSGRRAGACGEHHRRFGRQPAGRRPAGGAGGHGGASGTGEVRPAPNATSPSDTGRERRGRNDLTDGERDHLERSVNDDLAEARRLVNGVDRSKMTSEQASTLDSVEGLMQSASTAHQRGEVRTAAALAHKARLLAAVLREQ